MARAPGVLADPAGVVADLVAGIELSLDRASIEDVVARVAGGVPSSAASPGHCCSVR